MIQIQVNGHTLSLRRGTALTVELNNALFAAPDIEGDVTFAFSLPVQGNEAALGFAHIPQCEGSRRLSCTVTASGGLTWNGTLVVQKYTSETVTAALVLNPYPDGFADRSLTEDEDPLIVISQTRETHTAAWARFLAAAKDDPDIKFAPFLNDEGYGSDNENWGFWRGHARTKIVNSLFHDPAGELIESTGRAFSQTANRWFELENEDGTDADGSPVSTQYTEINQLAFCPQIRLARILEIWCRNAGYTFVNHLGEDFNATYLQSQKSLDGTMAQYGGEGSTFRTETYNVLRGQDGDVHYMLDSEDSETGIHVTADGDLQLLQTGWWEVALTPLHTAKDRQDVLNHWSTNASSRQKAEINSFGFRMAIYSENTNLITLDETNTLAMWKCDNRTKSVKLYINDVLSASGIRLVMFCKKPWGTRYIYQAVNLKWEVALHQVGRDTVLTGFNIFRRAFRIPELLPDVSNASFLKTLLETMGLCWFVSAKTGLAELVPYAMLRHAHSLDLTAYELTRETEVAEGEDTMRTFRLTPLTDEGYSEDLRLPDVDMRLPDAYACHEHLVLRRKTNTLYRAAVQESAADNWTESWEEHSGNPDRLEVGEGKEERREPAVKIPHQRIFGLSRRRPGIDTATGDAPQLAVANFTICSDLYNASEKPSDIILTQYRGFRRREWQPTGEEPLTYLKSEVMLPVWAGGFSLTAKGANSLGEKYVRPVLELLGHKTMTYKFRLPANMLQQVEDLLRPSELAPQRQTRFLIVRNVKSVPKRITIQIENDRDDTVLCQVEAVKVY